MADMGGSGEGERQVESDVQGGTPASGSLEAGLHGIWEVAGELVDIRDFLVRLRGGDEAAEKLIVEQIRHDKDQGQPDGWGLVVLTAAYTPIARTHLTRTLAWVPWDEREDAWHRALYQIWERIETYDAARSKFRTWVCRMAQWQSPRPRISDALTHAAGSEVPEHAAHEESDGISPEQQERLGRALSRLTEAQRDLLEMRFRDGLTYEEIVDRLDREVSREAVRIAVHRIMSRLRREFDVRP